MVQPEVNHKKVMIGPDHMPENVSTFATSHLTRPVQHNGDRVSFRHCGKLDHEEANYFKIISYPTGQGLRARHSSKGRGRVGQGRVRAMTNEVTEATLGRKWRALLRFKRAIIIRQEVNNFKLLCHEFLMIWYKSY